MIRWAVILLGCGALFVLLNAHAAHRTYRSRTPRVDVPLDVVIRVARAQRLRYALAACAYLAACAGVARLELELVPRMLLLALPASLLALAVAAFARAWRIGELHDLAGVATRYDGHYVFVARGGELIGWITAWPRTLERASSLPRATATERSH